MVTRYLVHPFNMASEGARAVADVLDGQLIRLEGSRYSHQDGDVVINWGNGSCRFPFALNNDVSVCINKLKFFQRLAGTGLTPAFSTDQRGLACPVICRTRIEGADGEGAVIADRPDQLVNARLYVQLEPKTAEYRVHVGRKPDGQIVIIGAQQKFRRNLEQMRDQRIWTGDCTYFVWTVGGLPVVLPPEVERVSLATLASLSELTFAGLDVIFDSARNKAFVVEANSAPMMTLQSARLYANFFRLFATESEPIAAPPVVTPSYEALEQRVAALEAFFERLRSNLS